MRTHTCVTALALIGNGVQSGAANAWHTKQHAWNYLTQTDYCTLILGVFPLDQIGHVGVSVSRDLKLFHREIIFEVLWKPRFPELYTQGSICRGVAGVRPRLEKPRPRLENIPKNSAGVAF